MLPFGMGFFIIIYRRSFVGHNSIIRSLGQKESKSWNQIGGADRNLYHRQEGGIGAKVARLVGGAGIADEPCDNHTPAASSPQP